MPAAPWPVRQGPSPPADHGQDQRTWAEAIDAYRKTLPLDERTQLDAGGRAADDAAAIADRFNVAVAPIHMSRLKAYEDAPALRQTPQELEPQGGAAQEVAGLFTFLSEQASMITGKHESMSRIEAIGSRLFASCTAGWTSSGICRNGLTTMTKIYKSEALTAIRSFERVVNRAIFTAHACTLACNHEVSDVCRRRATIAFEIEDDTVTILGVYTAVRTTRRICEMKKRQNTSGSVTTMRSRLAREIVEMAGLPPRNTGARSTPSSSFPAAAAPKTVSCAPAFT